MITVLKELFAEHGIPEEIRSDNGPQFASHLFTEFTKDWNIKHSTSSPRNSRSNGQAESAVKIVKGLLTHAKCSGQDPYLALLAYRSTPVDSHLRSPAEMLYQCALRTTVPQRIRHKDPYAAAEHERLEERATQSAANHDHTGCHRKAPLYAGQSVSVINNDRTLWLQLQQAPTAPAVQPSVAPATPKQAAAQSPTAATRTQRKTTVTTDVQPPTGRTDVAPRRSGHVSKAPQRLLEHM